MIYHCILLLYCLAILPKIALERLRGKKHPAFLQRLGFFLPFPPCKKVIWIHAVSVGEVKAAVPFFHLLKNKFPDAWICITTTTATGQEEAKRSLADADAHLYLPLDFSYSVRRFVKTLNPHLFFLIEGDLWPNLLAAIKRSGCKIFLISGKMSKKSFVRWHWASVFAKEMFSHLDLICAQTHEHASRFLPFMSDPLKLRITGNLKFDMSPQKVKKLLNIEHPVLTLSSTHDREEELLLNLLKTGPWTIFLAPRHPERFEEVAKLLTKKNISFIRWSQMEKYGPETKVILVDVMGELGSCYANSELAIVGGSFVSNIGGHNVLEPCLYGCPVLFGPHAFAQKELVQKVLDAKAGIQADLPQVLEGVEKILSERSIFSSHALKCMDKIRGSTLATWEEIEKKLGIN